MSIRTSSDFDKTYYYIYNSTYKKWLYIDSDNCLTIRSVDEYVEGSTPDPSKIYTPSSFILEFPDTRIGKITDINPNDPSNTSDTTNRIVYIKTKDGKYVFNKVYRHTDSGSFGNEYSHGCTLTTGKCGTNTVMRNLEWKRRNGTNDDNSDDLKNWTRGFYSNCSSIPINTNRQAINVQSDKGPLSVEIKCPGGYLAQTFYNTHCGNDYIHGETVGHSCVVPKAYISGSDQKPGVGYPKEWGHKIGSYCNDNQFVSGSHWSHGLHYNKTNDEYIGVFCSIATCAMVGDDKTLITITRATSAPLCINQTVLLGLSYKSLPDIVAFDGNDNWQIVPVKYSHCNGDSCDIINTDPVNYVNALTCTSNCSCNVSGFPVIVYGSENCDSKLCGNSPVSTSPPGTSPTEPPSITVAPITDSPSTEFPTDTPISIDKPLNNIGKILGAVFGSIGGIIVLIILIFFGMSFIKRRRQIS